MNIYGFFNSPDVAEHCRSIVHTLNAVEAAVMVNQCNYRSLSEKHEAYRAVIKEYPDMEIDPGHNHRNHIPSFHNALKDIIAHGERELKKFLLTEQDSAYSLALCYRDDKPYDYYELFGSYKKACAKIHELFSEETLAAFGIIRKSYFDGGDYIEAKVSRCGEIIEISHNGIVPDETGEAYLLQNLYIDIPIPFKKGDLVETDDGGLIGSVYVLQGTCRDDSERNAKNVMQTDISDMTAEVYYEMDGDIECEVMHFYPDLRYCCSELSGEQRILKYVSLYLQDKICLCSLLKIQKHLMLDAKMASLKESHNLQFDLDRIGDDLLGDQ